VEVFLYRETSQKMSIAS
jgi:hypothetical protein